MNEKCMTKRTEGGSTPQYKKIRLDLGLLKRGFRIKGSGILKAPKCSPEVSMQLLQETDSCGPPFFQHV